ncbi:MAG: 2-C-methyl-D-erythritol 4-phosphate cytidylyltransferase [Deltaproteobacteria bacterium]|nr:2-C-methyl-D-erythritol 4-phosphate cytidylyltransferase [Deltaproteobacteria bacterium]
MPHVTAVIPAAGSGKRMGGNKSKQYLEIASRPIIAHTLQVFQEASFVDDIILVSPAAEIPFSRELVSNYGISKVVSIAEGGAERQDSIKKGLETIESSTDIVIVHDGVRPFIKSDILKASVNVALEYGAALVAVPVKDTVKKVNGGSVIETVPRNKLWLAQTPQTFSYDLIMAAYKNAFLKGIIGTDDASLVEILGKEVRIVMGSYDNIKITTPEDLLFAEAILKEKQL